MYRSTYSASFSPILVFGGGDGFGNGNLQLLNIHVAPTVAAGIGAGSGVQVTFRWNDGFVDLSDDTIISLDELNSGVAKQVPIWTGSDKDVTMEATLVSGSGTPPEYELSCLQVPVP